MEMMNYDKIKPKSNAGIIAFSTFIILGTGAVFFGLANEQEPKIIGQNALKEVNSVDIYVEPIEKIEYTIKSVSHVTGSENSIYSSDISIPEISVNGVALEDINEEITSRFTDKFNTLSKDVDGSLENKFLYKVSFKKYENIIDEKTYVSIVLDELITAGDEIFSNNTYTYVLDLNERYILTQDEAAPLVLGYSYRKKMREQIKEYVIQNEIITEESYTYSITGLEEFYIKNNEFHVIFNPGQPYDEKLGVLDIIIEE